MKRVVVPSFEAFSELIEFGRTLERETDLCLDFSKLGFAKPSGMVLLSQLISRAVSRGKVASFTNAGSRSYPANMGFYEACGLDVERAVARGGVNYLPLQRVDLNRWRDLADSNNQPYGAYVDQRVGRLAYVITREARGDLFDLVKYCMREVVRNALEHGGGDSLWVCGQFWPQRNEVELTIYDNGMGIRKGLRSNPSFASLVSDRDAIRLAILPSMSGKKVYKDRSDISRDDGDGPWSNSGFGLYITSQLARECGFFVLGSGDSIQQLSGNSKSDREFGLNGSYISMRFDVSELQRTAKRVEEIASKGEGFAKRHFAAGAEVLASAASKFIVQ